MTRYPAAVLAVAFGCLWSACTARTATQSLVTSPPAPAAALEAPAALPAPAGLTVPVTPRCGGAGCTAVERLEDDLDAIFGAPSLSHAVWSVLVQSLDTGEVLYRLNPDTLVVPASNMKIVTMAVGADRLGWDYRYETRLETSARVGGGVLGGDLVVVGSGDPSLHARGDDGIAAFGDWARALRSAGIRQVDGRIIGDDDAFEDQMFGDGWAWDDLAFGYAAPIGALQYHESLVEVVIRPGSRAGEPLSVVLRPEGSGLVVVNRGVTAPRGTQTSIRMSRFPGREELEVDGSLAVGAREAVRSAAVQNPTRFFVSALKRALELEGIAVTGDAVDIDDLDEDERKRLADERLAGGEGARRVLVRHQSPPLSAIGTTLMKMSQNTYAETLLRTLSAVPGPATVDEARPVVEDTLARWGIAPGQYRISDGSGLSRTNLLSASLVLRVLRQMALDPRHAEPFAATLPIAGRDGTLASRLKGTRAEAHVLAKTGTLRGVRALSGYTTTADGERLVFSIVANNFTPPTAVVDATVDGALEHLVSFSRQPR